MDDSKSKDRILRQTFYNSDTGFGSINQTYQDARKLNPNITLAYTKEWLSKQKNRQLKHKDAGFNSYIADSKQQEYQIDLAVYERSAQHNDGYKYIFCCIDIFTKELVGIPLKTKTVNDIIQAMKECINKMGKPEVVYGDQEGAWVSKEFQRLMNENNIELITTFSHAPMIERAIQTLKNIIHARIQGLDEEHETWLKYLQSALKKYNSTPHSTTSVSPNEAKREDNHMKVWLNIKSKATFKRKYPPLRVGDRVRTYIKPNIYTKKSYMPKWSNKVYTITAIREEDGKDTLYMLDDPNRRHLWLRHLLLKVDDVEDKDTV
jgi:hypothetical protein